MKTIVLKAGKEAPVRRFHPWVFSGAIQSVEPGIQDGDVVEVQDHNGNPLGTGHFQDGSIKVRLFAYARRTVDAGFWTEKIRAAHAYRRQLGLDADPGTNAFRLVHAEGDGLPGLIVDLYGPVAVLQCHSIGMHRERLHLVEALRAILGQRLQAVFDKSRNSLPARYAQGVANTYLYGSAGVPLPVLEKGHQFLVDWERGQKTGFFLDQRENRELLAHYAAGKKMLNAFSYSGGFSVYALAAGAREVDSVDVSKEAIALAGENVRLNLGKEAAHRTHAEDVSRFLRDTDRRYDLMVVDPPAFAKTMGKRHQAVQGYKRLNALALNRLEPGGILFTFSCSQVVDDALFYNTLVAAALEAGRRVRVMHRLNQGPDHPVSIHHPEGAYLKGLVLYVE